jgi:hypothetical protein
VIGEENVVRQGGADTGPLQSRAAFLASCGLANRGTRDDYADADTVSIGTFGEAPRPGRLIRLTEVYEITPQGSEVLAQIEAVTA